MKNTKKVAKLLSIIIVTITIMLSVNNIVFATLDTASFEPPALTDKDTSDAFAMGNSVLEMIRTVGLVVAIIGLIAIGIKFMVGSVEQRAEYKKTLIPYIIGCLLIFTITTLVGIIADLVSQIKA